MKLPAIHLYPGDWLRDNISGCSLAAQGLWLRMMFLMHDSDRYGYLSMNGTAIPSESLARRCGCDSLAQYESLLTELTVAGVPERSKEGAIFSRRMVRDDKRRRDGATYGRKGGNPILKKTINHTLKGICEDEIEDETSVAAKGSVRGVPFPSVLDTPEFREWWRKWGQHRREIKKKLTPQMEEASLKKLASYGLQTAIHIVEFTLEKGWQGLGYGPATQQNSFSPKPPTPKIPDAPKPVAVAPLHEIFPCRTKP